MGLALVVAGALLLIVAYCVGWTGSNWVLLVGLMLVITGTVLHVRQQKSREKY
ncbi:MAG: hypothetical protein J1E58_04785 [Prevotella sp.]|nr:hypothetical protein [Prevotella sp.]